jgi:hypothetical protein
MTNVAIDVTNTRGLTLAPSFFVREGARDRSYSAFET